MTAIQRTDWNDMAQEAQPDDIGTVRVCERFGTVAVYVKVGDNSWRTVYVDPCRGQSLVPASPVAESVAGFGTVVFVPKPVV